MNQNQLKKYINNDLSETEKEEVLNWINSDVRHQELYNQLKTEHTLHLLKQEQHSTSDYSFITKKKKRKQFKIYAAAVTILVLCIVSIKYSSSILEQGVLPNLVSVTNINGAHKNVTLPDGTSVTLNSNSSISYPEKFNDSVRYVNLSGEAYFDVQHNPNKPFIVDVNGIDIRVLGTSFNVKAYDEDQKVETTLVSGKVEIWDDSKEKNLTLSPSERATFNKKKQKLRKEKVNSDDIIAWKEGKLIFKQVPLKHVIKDLERKYGVDITVKSRDLNNYKYTGTFNNLTLDETLDILEISLSINYTKSNKKIIISKKPITE